MAEFLSFEKNGQKVLINLSHIVAVHYKPETGVAVSPTGIKKQKVHILGQIIFKSRYGDSDIFGLATIETLEFDSIDEAYNFVDTYFGQEEKKPNFWHRALNISINVLAVIAIIGTLFLIVSSLFNRN